jgi:hypothetical protein
MAGAAMDYLNAVGVGQDGSARGVLLIALGEVQAKETAAHAAMLRRFDAHTLTGTARPHRGRPPRVA